MPFAELVERVPREAAIARERGDREVDVAVDGPVRVPGVLEALGEADHVRHVVGRPREDVGRQQVHRRRVDVERLLVCGRDLGRAPAFQAGSHEHAVLALVEPLVPHVAHVGDVLDLEHAQPVVDEGPSDEVRQEERPEVADVRVAVHRRTAAVHPHEPRLDGLHGLDAAGQRVAQPEGHRGHASGATAPVGPAGKIAPPGP